MLLISNIDLVKMLTSTVDQYAIKFKKTLPISPSKKLIQFVDDRLGHDYRYGLNISKIEKELNWSPKENFESGLKKTVEWYLNILEKQL